MSAFGGLLLRDARHCGPQYSNYMLPVDLDGLSGLPWSACATRPTSPSAICAFRPTNAARWTTGWGLRAALADPPAGPRRRAAYVRQAAPDGKPELAGQLETSVLRALTLYAGDEVGAPGGTQRQTCRRCRTSSRTRCPRPTAPAPPGADPHPQRRPVRADQSGARARRPRRCSPATPPSASWAWRCCRCRTSPPAPVVLLSLTGFRADPGQRLPAHPRRARPGLCRLRAADHRRVRDALASGNAGCGSGSKDRPTRRAPR